MNVEALNSQSGAQSDRGRIVDFDFYVDDRFDKASDYHSALSGLNAEAPPVFWTEAQGGHWVIRAREAAYRAASSPDLFSSRAMNIPADDAEFDRPPSIPIMLDPPLHTSFRKPLMELFRPQRMAALEGKVRAFAVELIDAVKDKGGCDFVQAIAEPLPVLTFMDLVGFDKSRLKEFRELAIEASVDPDPEVKRAGAMRVAQIMSDFVDDRLANPREKPQDLADELMRLEIDGRPIEVEEMKGYCRLLFFAGLDTVVNAMSFGISYLARHPEAQAQMRAMRGNIRPGVEELLRLGGPAAPGRYVTRDEEFFGAKLRRGDRALLELPAANLDAEFFPDPMRFDPHRENIAHLTFNTGPHRCIGQHLARVELRVMYEEWLDRIPDFRLDPAHPPRHHGGMVMGVDSLPVVWS